MDQDRKATGSNTDTEKDPVVWAGACCEGGLREVPVCGEEGLAGPGLSCRRGV